MASPLPSNGRYPDGTRHVPEDEQVLATSPAIARVMADEYEASGVCRRPPVRLLRSMAYTIETLRDQLAAIEANDTLDQSAVPRDLISRDEVVALLPHCHRLPCPRVGVKWVARTVLCCDDHGSPWLLDAPWAEFARKEGLRRKLSSKPSAASRSS